MISEKGSRGRPPRFSPELMLQCEALGLFLNIHSRRGRINVMYGLRALKAVGNGKDPAFHWLANLELMGKGKPKAWQATILQELGRIDDPDDLRTVAARICELQPRVKDAVQMIRKWRIGRSAPFTQGQLATALVATLNDFLRAHGEMTLDEALKEVDILRVAVKAQLADQ